MVCAEFASRVACRHASWRNRRHASWSAACPPPRRLFRDGHDRLRPGLLLHRLSMEFGHGRRRRLARLFAPTVAPWLHHDRSPEQRRCLLLFRAGLFRRRGRPDGVHPALAFRAHDDRDPRKRTPCAFSRHSRRAAYLDCVFAFLLFHGVRGRAVCGAQQFRRSARPALRAFRRFCHHGGDGRHAHFLGAAPGRDRFCRPAGLSIERHRELDVVHRHPDRADRIVLPARHSRAYSATERGMNVLEVKNVSKRFGNLVAVRDVSLTVKKGELRAVIGPNGAGKTTFFNLISGFFPPSAGTVIFEDMDVTDLSAQKRVVLGMARTFQITEIFPELSVYENVRIGAESAAGFRLRPWLSAVEKSEIRNLVDETLALCGLTDKAGRLVGELAHGHQRATEIAMALTLRPRLLLLD